MLKQLSIAAIFIAAASASQGAMNNNNDFETEVNNLPTVGYRGYSQGPKSNFSETRPLELSEDENVDGEVERSESEVEEVEVKAPKKAENQATKFLGNLSYTAKKAKKETDSKPEYHFKPDSKRVFVMEQMPSHQTNSKGEVKKIKTIKKLNKKKKSLVEDEKAFIVRIKRSKSKKGKKSRKSKDASSKGALRFETKKSFILNVGSDITSGIEVTDFGSTIIKTKGKTARNYAIINGRESHSIALKSMKNKKEGHALLKFEKIRVSSAINAGEKKKKRTYRIVNAPVAMNDAKNICEMFNFELAEVHTDDFDIIAKEAVKYVEQGREEIWVDSVSVPETETGPEKKLRKEQLESGIQIPGVFNIRDAQIYPYASEIAEPILGAIEIAKEAVRVAGTKDTSKASKVRREQRDNLHKFTQDFLGKYDPTNRRIVLCRVK